MNTVIVYIDDAEYARQTISTAAAGEPTHWVLVACAPRMTHRISKWVSHSARESWRAKWADKLFAQVLPWLDTGNAQVSTVLAKIPLPELMEQLQKQYGADAELLDARRPKQETAVLNAAPVQQQAPAVPVIIKKPSRTWSLPGTLAGLFCMMFIAVE